MEHVQNGVDSYLLSSIQYSEHLVQVVSTTTFATISSFFPKACLQSIVTAHA
jgi:hypothetical protein